MTFNQRRFYCWLINVCFAIAAFCYAMSPAMQNRFVHASAMAIQSLIIGLVWSQLATSTHAEVTTKESPSPN